MEGFAKWMMEITTTTPGGRAPFFVNSQRGRVFGGELLLRVRPEGPFSGFLSYTLMRSERANDGEAYRLFNRDQTHIFSAAQVLIAWAADGKSQPPFATAAARRTRRSRVARSTR